MSKYSINKSTPSEKAGATVGQDMSDLPAKIGPLPSNSLSIQRDIAHEGLLKELLLQPKRLKCSMHDIFECHQEISHVLETLSDCRRPIAESESLASQQTYPDEDQTRRVKPGNDDDRLLESRIKVMLDLHVKLTKLENGHRELRSRFETEILDFLHGPRQDDSTSKAGGEDSVAADSSDDDGGSDSETLDCDPVLKHYYDTVADVKIRQERCDQLKWEYFEESGRRNQLLEQGSSMRLSTEEFEQQHLQDLAEVREERDEFMQAAESAWRACREKNLDPQPRHRQLLRPIIVPSLDGSTASRPQSPEDMIVLHESHNDSDRFGIQLSSLSDLSIQVPQRVEHWIPPLPAHRVHGPVVDAFQGASEVEKADSADSATENRAEESEIGVLKTSSDPSEHNASRASSGEAQLLQEWEVAKFQNTVSCPACACLIRISRNLSPRGS